MELGELAGADVIVDPADLEGAEPTDTNSERNLAVLREYAAREPEGKPKRLVLRFLLSPVAILGDERVEAIELVRNRLEADASGALRAVPTGETRDAPVRHRLSQRRLPRRRAARRAVRRGPRHDPERAAAASRRARLRRRAGSSAARAA